MRTGVCETLRVRALERLGKTVPLCPLTPSLSPQIVRDNVARQWTACRANNLGERGLAEASLFRVFAVSVSCIASTPIAYERRRYLTRD